MATYVSGPGTLHDVDLTSPATHADDDLSAMWTWLRERHPLAWNPLSGDLDGFWVVSTHRLAAEVYRDTKRFTSVNGNVLATLLGGGDSASGRMLAVSDGARHQQIRRELLRFFTRQTLAPIEARITETIRRLVGAAIERGDCDFAVDVAERIPLAAICDLLEIPEGDRTAVYAHASSALAAVSTDASDLDARLARNEILLYFAKLIRSREGLPGEGLLSRLIELSHGPLGLSHDELLFNCYSLLLGGDETTRLSMVGTVKAFADHPAEWHRLRGGDVAISTAVEELLRWTTPIMHSGRTAVADTTVLDQPITAGQVVTVWNSSANFDPQEFAMPWRLDLSRTPNRHLSFAYGPHFCLGAQLARIEIAALLRVLIEMVDEMELTGTPQRIYSTFLAGYHRLPVRLTPRKSATEGAAQ